LSQTIKEITRKDPRLLYVSAKSAVKCGMMGKNIKLLVPVMPITFDKQLKLSAGDIME